MVMLFAKFFQTGHGAEIVALAIEPAYYSVVFRYIDPANRVAMRWLGIRLLMDDIRTAIFTADHGLDYSVTYIDD